MSHVDRLDILIFSCGLTTKPSGASRSMSHEQNGSRRGGRGQRSAGLGW
jgi:hypothetical protein